MKKSEFEETMRRHLYRKPFLPFEVEMKDGRVIVVDSEFAMSNGMAAFISQDESFVDIACEEVKSIRPLSSQIAQ